MAVGERGLSINVRAFRTFIFIRDIMFRNTSILLSSLILRWKNINQFLQQILDFLRFRAISSQLSDED